MSTLGGDATVLAVLGNALTFLHDLVTEAVKVKHPMDQDIRAQQGIEW